VLAVRQQLQLAEWPLQDYAGAKRLPWE